jgi:5-methylcytosine-specific restriction protein A
MPTIKLLPKRDDRVPTTKKREYQEIYQDKRWKKLRRLKMVNNPLCERCEAKGITRKTDEVHHVIPFDRGINNEERAELAFDYNNLMSVCFDCHEELHKELKNDSSHT